MKSNRDRIIDRWFKAFRPQPPKEKVVNNETIPVKEQDNKTKARWNKISTP